MIRTQAAALAALLSAIPCMAQPPAELLQKGIYLQDTESNPEAAIAIYRQITGSAGQSAVAVQAQYRIAQAMLQKGDLNGASTEFLVLAAKYPEGKAIVARLASTGPLSSAPSPRGILAQSVHDGRYRDEPTGLEFTLPASWTANYYGPSSDGGNMFSFAAPSSPVDYGVWTKPNAPQWSSAEVQDHLSKAPQEKAAANSGFKLRPDSVQPRTVAGQQAISAVADIVENGRKLVNYYIWVYSPKTHSVFLARRIAPEDLATVQVNLDSIAASAQVP